MRLGVYFDGFSSTSEMLAAARAAEEAGAASLWFAQHMGQREGEVNKLRGAHMKFLKGVAVPIYVASTGPQILRLAGEIGDGVLLSTGLTLATMRRCLEHAEAGARRKGRELSAVRRVGFISLAVAEDAKSARAAMLPKLAFLFRSRNHAENIKSSGLDIDH